MRALRTLHVAAAGGASDLSEVSPRQPPHLVLVPSASTPDHAARRQEFGPRLKAARERHGVSLDDIAKATKVSPGLLHALERSDVSRWPKGIFRRAFFRDYVAAIGLTPETHVREFLELFPDGEEHPAPPPLSTAAAARFEPVPALRLTLATRPAWTMRTSDLRQALADLPAFLLLAAGSWWWTDGNLIAGAATVAVCYYPRMVTAIGRRAATLWRSRTGGQARS